MNQSNTAILTEAYRRLPEEKRTDPEFWHRDFDLLLSAFNDLCPRDQARVLKLKRGLKRPVKGTLWQQS